MSPKQRIKELERKNQELRERIDVQQKYVLMYFDLWKASEKLNLENLIARKK